MELSRTEWILKYGLGEVSTLPPNLSRIEELLVLLIESGGAGGGGGGTTNYNALNNKPSIEGNTLQGNKTLSQLGIQSALVFDSTPTAGSNNPVTSNGVATALSGKVDTESNKGLSTNDYTTAEKTKLAGIKSGAEVNEILKVFVNDTEITPNSDREVYITVLTNTVSNLINYYKKTETYSSSEVDALIAGIVSIRMEIVSSLPDTGESNVIYLIPSGANNVYSQYIYTSATWSLIGTTEVDLSNYYTKAQVDELLEEKQDELTFDTTPTANSENPVTSGGLYTALNTKQDKLTIDVEPEEDSINPVTSGGVYEALSGLQEALTFDTEPTINSTNPVTSGGVYEALQNVSVDVATNQNAGIVKPDGETITIDNNGVISSQGAYSAGNGIIINEHEISTETVTFTGTEAQWNALTTAQKKTYTIANITDDKETDQVTDTVESGNMLAVTSNAVFNNIGYKRIDKMSYISKGTYTYELESASVYICLHGHNVNGYGVALILTNSYSSSENATIIDLKTDNSAYGTLSVKGHTLTLTQSNGGMFGLSKLI